MLTRLDYTSWGVVYLRPYQKVSFNNLSSYCGILEKLGSHPSTVFELRPHQCYAR